VLNASEGASHRRPVRCAIYTRQSVSSSDPLPSCEVQYEACRLYVESQREHGWTLLPDQFDDDGHSGALLDRPALNRVLALIRRGAVGQILVHRLDRLSRSVRHCVTLLDEFRRLEVGLVIVTAPELGHSAQDNFMLNIMASFAEFERELIAARISDSRAKLKSRELRFAGGAPFGYESNPLTRQLVPNDEEAAAVKWFFVEAAAGKKPSQISEETNCRGYRTKATSGRRGGPWTARQIVATLRNPVHVGMLRDGNGIRLGRHDPIISYELFNAVAKALDDRQTRKEHTSRYGAMWPLKGRIYCGACDRPLTPHSTRRGNIVYRYYRCRATAGGRPPCGYQVAAGIIEAAVADQLPRRHRDELDSRRIREHVERVVYEDDFGVVTIRLNQ
jgi:site-specific DNA recombinase